MVDAAVNAPLDANLASGGEFDGVIGEIQQDLYQETRIAPKLAGGIGFVQTYQFQAFLLDLQSQGVSDLFEDGADVEVEVLELDLAGVDLGKVEDAVVGPQQ